MSKKVWIRVSACLEIMINIPDNIEVDYENVCKSMPAFPSLSDVSKIVIEELHDFEEVKDA